MSQSTLPPELIEKLRQSGIRLDRNGRFWHEGEQIVHERFVKALLRWLDQLEDGRPILRLDAKRYAYVEVEDSLLLAVSLRWQDDRAYVKTNDDAEEELRYDSLQQASDNSMYCRVRDAGLLARFTTPAYYALAEHIEEGDKGFELVAAGQRFSIGTR